MAQKKIDHEKTLREWTERDLTAAAEAGELPHAFEVEEALEKAADVIASGRHLVLSGESGVGKTALVYELVRRSVRGEGPEALRGRRVLQISLRHRASSLKEIASLRPEMQHLVDALCAAASTGSAVVPFFRDFHLADAFSLEPLFQSLGYRLGGVVLGEGELARTAALFEASPELEERYVVVTVEEPSLARTEAILASVAHDEERRTGRRFRKEAIQEAVHLSHRFLARSHMPRKALDLLSGTASVTGRSEEVTAADVVDRFSRVHRVPRVLVDPDLPLDLSGIVRRFSEKVLGQREAIQAVTRMLGLVKSGLSDVRRPFGVFLFAGPTGVGKTHVAQLLAEELFGSRDRVLRVNMADYQYRGAAGALFGDPYEDRLPQRRGVLSQRVAGQPFAVLLLDEFEKAGQEIHDRFLQLFDEGSFINGAGETVPCRSMILIATSNAGADVYRAQPLGFYGPADLETLGRNVERRLSQTFRPELLNRFDQVVHFRPLTREDVRTIAQRELAGLAARSGLSRRGLVLRVDEAVVDWLAVNGYDPHFGARFLKRTLERNVTSVLAETLVDLSLPPGTEVRLEVERGQVVARRPVPAPAGPERLEVSLPVGTTVERRPLTPEELADTARRLAASAASRRQELTAKREEARGLLASMGADGFWNGGESHAVLARYRELDVEIQVEDRLDAAFRALEALGNAPTPSAVERAARALAEWDERLAAEGARAVWLLVERVDSIGPARSSSRFLSELVEMELAWCARLRLAASVAAYEVQPGSEDLVRVLLDVEGPGAGPYLAMEEGVHRRQEKDEGDTRVRVEILPRPGPAAVEVRPVKARQGPLGLKVRCRARLLIPESGVACDLFGPEPEALGASVAALRARRLSGSAPPAAVARTYGLDGAGARDPRTAVVVARQRDVLRGNLDRFLEAWRQRGTPG